MSLISAERKISKAKSQLVFDNCFFAIIAMRLDFVEENTWCKTAATDGIHIFWNREFIDKLTVEETKGLIAHEVLHVVWLHMLRGKGRIHKLFNIAGDIVINEQLIQNKFTLPKDGIDPRSERFKKYKDWNTERIYDDLEKNAVKITVRFDGEGGDGDDKEGDEKTTWGGVVEAKGPDGKSLSPAELSEMEAEIKQAISEAAQAAKNRGQLPAGMEGLIKAAGQPKVDWKAYIQNWVSGISPDDYSWARPNRKMFANYGIYMPRIKMYGAGHGLLSIDTSGSVSDQELKEYVREIVGVIEMCKPDKLTIIQHDAVITKVDVWERGEDFSDLKIKGRGGTCIQPSFKYAENMDEPIDWMILFTDCGIVDWPNSNNWPNIPVLVCATGDNTMPADVGAVYLDIRKPII